MAGQRQEAGRTVGVTAPAGLVRGLFRPVRGLVRARPWAARTPEPDVHGRIADGSGPQSRLEWRMRWSAAGASGGRDGL